jgi:hypothetical protein
MMAKRSTGHGLKDHFRRLQVPLLRFCSFNSEKSELNRVAAATNASSTLPPLS